MCFDANAMAWAQAWMSHQPPPAGKVGFMYMLAGGTDASNTDPYATAPSTKPLDQDGTAHHDRRQDADPDTSVPYVMWAGPRYQHLMASA
jgi:hypothetical protein